MNKPKKTKKMDRRDFIKKSAQMAGAGVLASGLSSCNLLLDETTGGGLLLKGDCGKILYQTTGNALAIIDLNKDFEITSVSGVVVDTLGSFYLSPSRIKITYALLGDLRSVNVDGTGDSLLLTDRSPAKSGIWYPHFSLDGSKIVFYEVLNGPVEGVFTINSDGSGVSSQLIPATVASYPVWSPDGSKIAYISGGNLLSMTASGTALNVPSVMADNTSRPSWSSDGSKLIYTDAAGGFLYVVNSSGGSGVSLGISGTFPSYSPSGEQIAYVSGSQIYIADSDGSNSKPCPGVTNAVAIEWR
ncbi:MAG: hypothetical protein IEMM0008_1454 [bacterium]|nr:MAG: hypothetical protein IEMM0008_1454 [bacterium]